MALSFRRVTASHVEGAMAEFDQRAADSKTVVGRSIALHPKQSIPKPPLQQSGRHGLTGVLQAFATQQELALVVRGT